nr:hypothetical protein BDOA9_0160320 [Bradyrhizobium sp. DOA9]
MPLPLPKRPVVWVWNSRSPTLPTSVPIMKPKMCSVSKPSSALTHAGVSAAMHASATANLQAPPRIPCPEGVRRLMRR